MSVDISSEAVERLAACIGKTCACALGPNAEQPVAATLRAQAERIAEIEAEKLALAQKFDESHPDPALMARIILKSIDDELRSDDMDKQIASARNDALREAARVASNACLVPPDGGIPTEAEANVCDEAHRRILALIKEPTT